MMKLKRFKGDRGASLPEYALIVGVVVLGMSVAAQSLADDSSQRMTEDSECIGNPYQAACETGADGGGYWTTEYP